jgi:hypothetical protein
MENLAKIDLRITFKGEKMKEQNEVVENLEVKTEEVAEDISKDAEGTVEEIGDETKENIEQKVDDSQENSEVSEEDSQEEVSQEEKEDDTDITSQIKNMKKHDAAALLVQKAKFMVNDAENQLEECKLLLADDLKGYEKAKAELKANGLDASEELLLTLGYVAEDVNEDESSEEEEDSVVFEPKEEVAPLYVRDVSSGKFTGFLMALIAGGAVSAGSIYYATQKLGVTLDVSKVPTPETMKPIFAHFGTLVGMGENANVGMALVGAVTLLVMWIVYAIRVSSKGSANLNTATEQLAAAEKYTAHKSSCKEEMDKVDAYIHDAIDTLKTYQVILNEQQAKLARILYVEKTEDEEANYHEKSLVEMKDTHELISAIKDFMSVPMSEEGKLSGKSSLFLHRAKSKIQKILDRLY